MFFLPLDKIPVRKRITWLGFAGALTLLYCWGVYRAILTNKPITIIGFFQTVITAIGLIAIWGLALRKRIFNQKFWRIFFFIDLFFYFLIWQTSKTPDLEIKILVSWFIFITVVIYIPYYIALFIYAFRSVNIWKPDKLSEGKTNHTLQQTEARGAGSGC